MGKHGAAIITGATAIIAATLAAWFTSASTRDVMREESRRVAEVRDQDAQGAARVLIGEFLVAGEELGDWVSTGALVPFGPDFPVAIGQEELGLIAARVTLASGMPSVGGSPASSSFADMCVTARRNRIASRGS